MKSSTKATNRRPIRACGNLARTAMILLSLAVAVVCAAGPKNHLNVRGTGVGVDTPPVNITPLTGDLEGIIYGYDDPDVTCEGKVGEDGTIFFCVTHLWDVAGQGTFYTRGDGLLSPTETPGVYQFSEWQTFLPGGTGDFAGTLSGSLVLQGIVDLNTGGASFDYHGVIFVNK